ncbi:ABC transporter permease [Actinomadura montaniterrae]|uniref:ABC transporter permease n=1 Tax=Actinomadura montaniterrae TaxID=1803903 RepID=A0A6L3W2P7_9ACTN|nr:ABC transporter permease [Actinomadura montaniterrae]KAB2384839.1 ABC transporter permease [Actinomadura montaniterrae]
MTSTTIDTAAGTEADAPAAARSGRWRAFVLRRLATIAGGLVFLLVITFLMIHLVPGDPVRASLGLNVSPEVVAARRAQLHLDRPLWVQFWYYVRDLAHFKFGTSIQTGEPVDQLIRNRLTATVQLAVAAMALVLVISLLLGMCFGWLTAGGRRRRTELGFNLVSGTVTAVPDFLTGTLLVVVFALGTHWFPASGRQGPQSMVLPALALALPPAFFLARVVRIETVKVLEQDYIRTAKANQLPTVRLFVRHVAPNVLAQSLTVAGLALGGLVGGSVVIENIFAWPGIGTAIVPAITGHDYPVVQACILVLGLIILLVNALVDVVLVALNPRMTALKEY